MTLLITVNNKHICNVAFIDVISKVIISIVSVLKSVEIEKKVDVLVIKVRTL
jgi:hypothetical protein